MIDLDKMNLKFNAIMKDLDNENSSLMGENTEDVSTTSSSESDDLHDVSEWNAERSEHTEDSEGVVEGALAKRTDFGNIKRTKMRCSCGMTTEDKELMKWHIMNNCPLNKKKS